MKRINFAIGVMALLFVFLLGNVAARRVSADTGPLACLDLTGCCGAAGCSGPGQVNGCGIVCAGGGSITCEVVKNGKCGGSDEIQ
jgi:hypothetical protein